MEESTFCCINQGFPIFLNNPHCGNPQIFRLEKGHALYSDNAVPTKSLSTRCVLFRNVRGDSGVLFRVAGEWKLGAQGKFRRNQNLPPNLCRHPPCRRVLDKWDAPKPIPDKANQTYFLMLTIRRRCIRIL